MLLAQGTGMPNSCANPLDQTTMTACAYKDFARADRALNVAWKKALGYWAKLDKSNLTERDNAPTYVQAMTKSQRAWIAFRDAQCVVEGQAMRGGSGEPMLAGQCLARLTKQRTKFLNSLGDGGQ